MNIDGAYDYGWKVSDGVKVQSSRARSSGITDAQIDALAKIGGYSNSGVRRYDLPRLGISRMDADILDNNGYVMEDSDGSLFITSKGEDLLEMEGKSITLDDLVQAVADEVKATSKYIGLKPSKMVLIDSMSRKRIPGTPEFASKAEATQWVSKNPIDGEIRQIGTFYGTDQDY